MRENWDGWGGERRKRGNNRPPKIALIIRDLERN